MRLELNGQTVADPVDPATIGPWLRRLPPGDEAIVGLRDDALGAFMEAGGTPGGGFIAQYRHPAGGEALLSKNRQLALSTVATLLASCAAGDRRWRGLVAWEATDPPRRSGGWSVLGRVPVAVWALLIFGIPYLAVIIPAARRGGPGAPGVGNAVAGGATIVVMAGFIGYLQFFFAVVRPLLMALAGRLLGVGIREGTGGWLSSAGTWDTGDDAPIAKTLVVFVLDAAILILGIIGPIAAVTIPLFLLAGRYGWGSTR